VAFIVKSIFEIFLSTTKASGMLWTTTHPAFVTLVILTMVPKGAVIVYRPLPFVQTESEIPFTVYETSTSPISVPAPATVTIPDIV
jgi:hypothetical protein